MEIDEQYMWRCLELAQYGRFDVAPNPMVGSVLVYKDKIIGEGYHRRCGEGHAEVNAIASVKNEELLRQATMYVSLEPCSHYGKTPPCVELILSKGIPRVVVACLDPFVKVAGRGVKRLREAGVEVVTGVLEKEAQKLNVLFMTAHTHQRPYVLLKWAQSVDGFMDGYRKDKSTKPIQLSNTIRLQYNHRKRAEFQAIMVGTNTVLLDNPSLINRWWKGQPPLRITMDFKNRLMPSLHLLDGLYPTLIFSFTKEQVSQNLTYVKIKETAPILPQVLATLYEKGINSLIVEGGSKLLNSFIDAGLWDECQVERASVQLKKGVASPDIEKVAETFKCVEINRYGTSHALKYYK